MLTVADVQLWPQTPGQAVDIGDVLLVKSDQSIIRGVVTNKDRLSSPSLRIKPQATILGPEVTREEVITFYPMFTRWIPEVLHDYADRFLLPGFTLMAYPKKDDGCHCMVWLNSVQPLRADILAVYDCNRLKIDESADISDWRLRFPTQSELRTYSAFMD